MLIVALAVTEALGLLIGASALHWHPDTVADQPDGFMAEALGWLHVGRVPILVLLVIFLTVFAVAGFASQFVARSALGQFVPLPAAMGLALIVGIFAVRTLGAALGKIIPKDETTAVADMSLVGRVGTIVIGTARAGKPAEARIRDEHGATHYVMVEPEEPEETFASGASVLLVRQLSGRRFHAIHNPKPELL
jgi:hypothetical protein